MRVSLHLALPALLLVLAAIPRFWQINRESYWYDEVVTVEVARSPGVSGVMGALNRLDASRAPLHPLVLHGWMSLFGTGEGTTRSLSALFGLGTVALVLLIGKELGGRSAGCWGMIFAAASPLLIQYDRETRMYSLLTMLTCFAWWNLLKFRESATHRRCLLQVALQAAIAYTHPLGLLMIVGLAAGWLADRRRSRLGLVPWLIIQVCSAIAIAPWISHYLDHPPESITSDQGWRLLLGMPIGFIGGDSRTLIICIGLVALALFPLRIRGLADRPCVGTWTIALWLALPPALLFLYSQIREPLFGPARYNVYAAPAFLILVGCGIARLRPVLGFALGATLLAIAGLPADYRIVTHLTKADWRSAAEWLEDNGQGLPLVVIPPVPGPNFELVVARYYVRGARDIVDGTRVLEGRRAIYSMSMRDGVPLGNPGTPPQREMIFGPIRDFSGTLRFLDIHLIPTDRMPALEEELRRGPK